MYLTLLDLLVGSPYVDRLISAEKLIGALRSRKTPAEIERVRAAVDTTRLIYERTFDYIQPGLTEIDISDFMHDQMSELAVGAAWDYDLCPIVNAGPESPVGHGAPGNRFVQRGQIVHLDFGVRQEDYCSDIQRVVYLLAEEEAEPPDPVRQGFDVVRAAVEAAAAACKPGSRGVDVDAAARNGDHQARGTRSTSTRPGTALAAQRTMAGPCSGLHGSGTARRRGSASKWDRSMRSSRGSPCRDTAISGSRKTWW